MLHISPRRSCKRCKRYQQIIKRRRRKDRRDHMMMVVVDDAFDAPTIKYLIRCVEEGLLEVQTKSFALSSWLETEAPTTLEMGFQPQGHHDDLWYTCRAYNLKDIMMSFSVLWIIFLTFIFPPQSVFAMLLPPKAYKGLSDHRNRCIAVKCRCADSKRLKKARLAIHVHALRKLQPIICGMSTSMFYMSIDTIVQNASIGLPRGSSHTLTTLETLSDPWIHHILGEGRLFPPYMFREVDQAYRRRKVHSALSLYSQGRKGDEGTYFPRNWGNCSNRRKLWIASLVELLTPVDFEHIVDSARMINIVPISPIPVESYDAAGDLAIFSQDLLVTGKEVDAAGASGHFMGEDRDEDESCVSDDAYDRFGNQKPQNAYSQDLPDGWKHLAIGRYEDLWDEWKYLG
ncbi:hypothetical protein PLEOSDRAFT_1085373 [Pleurotus ostreatus PC15]|uniref:Uncharacterized protein n=1 Tax=Pleurotus ostreatus (strain PC15) TaxID=1137138 RepID=A0A067NPT7_PLEO1|nr:hypothetical protein PLEOSDRAFT_1085373 [Pleurotus ostreatus PC15]